MVVLFVDCWLVVVWVVLVKILVRIWEVVDNSLVIGWSVDSVLTSIVVFVSGNEVLVDSIVVVVVVTIVVNWVVGSLVWLKINK